MVASKRIHCAHCQKKCSGNVLRYQDQYYHKQCFERQQSELAPADFKTTHYAGRDANPTTGSIEPQHQISPQSIEQRQLALSESSSKYPQAPSSNNKHSPAPCQDQVDGSSRGRQNLSTLDNQQAGVMASTTTRGQTLDSGRQFNNPKQQQQQQAPTSKAATLPHSISAPANGFPTSISNSQSNSNLRQQPITTCAGCSEKIRDGQALMALDLHWHVWCFKCTECKAALHGEYVAKDGKAYCERDYQKLFGITCVYCKRYITGKVLQAGEAHHFHPSCARCSKCGDPFVPGEEMYLQGEVTWHPRCGPGPDGSSVMSPGLDDYDESLRLQQLRASRAQSPSFSNRSHSRSASPFSFMTRQYGRSSPAYADSEAVGDLSRIYTISYLNADPNQGYLRRPIEPNAPKSPQFSRPTSTTRLNQAGGDRSRCSSRSNRLYQSRERSVPRGMYSVLSSMRSGSSSRARSPSMMNEEAVQLAQYPGGQKPNPNSVPTIERDDFPAPPFPYPDRNQQRAHHHHRTTPTTKSTRQGPEDNMDNQPANGVERLEAPVELQHQHQQRSSRPRSREISVGTKRTNGDGLVSSSSSSLDDDDPQFRKEEEELSKIANGIGKIFLQTLKEREKLRAWKRANLDPRNASRTPSATRELPSRMRYENPTNASPSRDLDRPRPWEDELEPGEQSPTRTRSSLGRQAPSQLSSSTAPAPASNSVSYGYKVVQSNRSTPRPGYGLTPGPYASRSHHADLASNGLGSEVSFGEQQRLAQNRSADLLAKAAPTPAGGLGAGGQMLHSELGSKSTIRSHYHHPMRSASSAHLHRSMPNVAHLHHVHNDGPPKLYPYHLLAISNYRLPPDVDRCHLERHLSNEEFLYIFHCDRLDFYRLPEWKRNELKRRAKLF